MKKILFVSALVVALCAPAWAINKCTGADGKVSFQDVSCPINAQSVLTKERDSTSQENIVSGYGAYTGGSSTVRHGNFSGGNYSSGNGTVYTGPRGGRYTITQSGNKSYIPRK